MKSPIFCCVMLFCAVMGVAIMADVTRMIANAPSTVIVFMESREKLRRQQAHYKDDLADPIARSRRLSAVKGAPGRAAVRPELSGLGQMSRLNPSCEASVNNRVSEG